MEFMLLSWQSAAICAAYFAAGLVDAVCGGGGLITVPVLMTIGIPVHLVTGTNQCSAVAGCLTSFCEFARGGEIHYKSGVTTAVMAIIGGIVGAKLNMLVPDSWLKIIMIALMPVMAVLLVAKKDFGEKDMSDSVPMPKLIISSALIGFAVGAYQGFYGPGAGMLYMLFLALFARLSLVRASGTAKIAMLFAAVSSSVTYAVSGLVIWRIVLIAVVFSIAGSIIGSRLALKKGAKAIRPVLVGVMALLFIKLIIG